MSSKYPRSGVRTRGSSSRQISKLCNLSRVEAESQNWKIEVELLDLQSNKWSKSRIVWLDSTRLVIIIIVQNIGIRLGLESSNSDYFFIGSQIVRQGRVIRLSLMSSFFGVSVSNGTTNLLRANLPQPNVSRGRSYSENSIELYGSMTIA